MVEKINLIRDNKDTTIAALNVYLDKIYKLTDDYFRRWQTWRTQLMMQS